MTKVYRNMTSFNMMAWGSFVFFIFLMLVGLYALKHSLMVKGDYLIGCCWFDFIFIYGI